MSFLKTDYLLLLQSRESRSFFPLNRASGKKWHIQMFSSFKSQSKRLYIIVSMEIPPNALSRKEALLSQAVLQIRQEIISGRSTRSRVFYTFDRESF